MIFFFRKKIIGILSVVFAAGQMGCVNGVQQNQDKAFIDILSCQSLSVLRIVVLHMLDGDFNLSEMAGYNMIEDIRNLAIHKDFKYLTDYDSKMREIYSAVQGVHIKGSYFSFFLLLHSFFMNLKQKVANANDKLLVKMYVDYPFSLEANILFSLNDVKKEYNAPDVIFYKIYIFCNNLLEKIIINIADISTSKNYKKFIKLLTSYTENDLIKGDLSILKSFINQVNALQQIKKEKYDSESSIISELKQIISELKQQK